MTNILVAGILVAGKSVEGKSREAEEILVGQKEGPASRWENRAEEAERLTSMFVVDVHEFSANVVSVGIGDDVVGSEVMLRTHPVPLFLLAGPAAAGGDVGVDHSLAYQNFQTT